MKLAAGQPFDEEHGTGANRTAQLCSHVRITCTDRCAEQNAAVRERSSAFAVGEESEVADANQTPG